MADEDLKIRQSDFLAQLRNREAMAQGQRIETSFAGTSDSRESLRGSRATMAALQAQLAQIEHARPHGVIPQETSNVVIGEQYLVFSVLEHEFALKAEHIQGVERLLDITPVPNVVPWVKGVINLRGSIASVVDLRAFLGVEPFPYNSRTRLLSVQDNEMVICLVVDGVSEMVPIPASAIINESTRQSTIPRWAAPYAVGSAVLDTRTIVLLDAARLLFSDKMQRYSDET